MYSSEKEKWFEWRISALLDCNNNEYLPVKNLICELIYDIKENPQNYGKNISLDEIDFISMKFIYRIFAKGVCAETGMMTVSGIKEDKEIKSVMRHPVYKGGLIKGLMGFGFSFYINKDKNYMTVTFNKNPEAINLLNVFSKKCAENKTNGFFAFLRLNFNVLNKKPEAPGFDYITSGLSQDIKNELIKTDRFLMGLKNLKFKRDVIIDCERFEFYNGGVIKYLSQTAFRYVFKINGNKPGHYTFWNIGWNGLGPDKKPKTDYTNQALEKLTNTSPDIVKEICVRFRPSGECHNCNPECGNKHKYNIGGKEYKACFGKVGFDMDIQNFEYIRQYAKSIDDVLAEIK